MLEGVNVFYKKMCGQRIQARLTGIPKTFRPCLCKLRFYAQKDKPVGVNFLGLTRNDSY
jgi:hypothetical protein